MAVVQRTTSKDLALGDVFNDFYVVPDYQREYVWEKREVEQLLRDTYQEYVAASKNGGPEAEYYLGSLIVTPAADGAFEVIDGQQRLTTTFIFFAALRAYINENKAPPIPGLDEKLAHANGNGARYRVVLGYEDSANLLQTLARDGSGVDRIIPTTRSIENILNSYRTMKNFFQEEFGSRPDELRAFYDHLTRYTKLVRIQSGTVGHALRLYESINQRGVGLDALELLKSLMFVYTPRDQFDLLRAKWKSLIDQLYAWGSLLEVHHRERQWRFLLFYLRQNFKLQDLKPEQLYPWFVNNEPQIGYKADPLKFVDTLLKAAYDIGR